MHRTDFVNAVLSKRMTKSEACRAFGISRPTGDKWLKRAASGEDLDDRCRGEFHAVNRIPEATEQCIIAYRREYPALGAVKIRHMMLNDGRADVPCASTINAVLKRNGLMTKEASEAATPYQRFEKAQPNEMWQADFKGWFTMKNGERCYPLNIIDDHSRFCLCCDPKPDETLLSVKPSFERVFREYGLPKVLLCDNGNPWGVSQTTGFTHFEVWMMDLGILTVHGRALHPQTQGKQERFNGTLKREKLKYVEIADMEDAVATLKDFRDFYNNRRPHHALGLSTPSSFYQKSEREYPAEIEPWKYPSGYEERTIKETGYITYGGQGYYLSGALAGLTVGVRESAVKGCVTVCYRQFKIARIDMDKRVFQSKKIYLEHGDPRFENEG